MFCKNGSLCDLCTYKYNDFGSEWSDYIGTDLANTTSQYLSYSLGIKVATITSPRGSFKNYVEKMRWVGGPKTLFVSTFRMKMSVQRWAGG